MHGNKMLTSAAFDARSLNDLRRFVKDDPRAGLKSVAQQMEGLFMQMMLKSMRDASFHDGLFNSQQTEMYNALHDQQLSMQLATQGSLGLGDAIMRQIGGEAPAEIERMGAISVPLALDNTTFKRIPQRVRPEEMTAQHSSALAAVNRPGGLQNGDDFISRLLLPAMDVAQKSGIPHQLIIAQAALETGWGNQEILTQDGKSSHNLFGIKATASWKGETTEIITTEYIDGAAQKIRAKFKVYDSYHEALSDYVSLLKTNPRYSHVVNSETPELAAHALQKGGYATDPKYADKLLNIIQQIKGFVKKGVSSYKSDFSSLF
ncbi:flagellar assembly peptidoglycan hydrolase FlgJ (plasmid) [Enterobacter asburiae]|uniref:flagellar assembly peptidoglycan hydrolase FlgJ n=1 Tax=Enterobacter asburiae TaxID=61645 RepID=UPI002933E590|nr:flagellar assembly peptidoglycan hydrolase FlgJ [Enterobacter asburiae]EMA4739871.1 flagellar assembly peptidoglycan hydrolase FlgJ [Enterobacter asburiae]